MKALTRALGTAISVAALAFALAPPSPSANARKYPVTGMVPLAKPLVSPPPRLHNRMHWFRWHRAARSLEAQSSGFGSAAVIGLESMRDLASLRDRYLFERVRAIPALRAAEVSIDPDELQALLAAAPADPRVRYVSPIGPSRRVMNMPSDPLVQTIDPSTNVPYEWQFAAAHVEQALELSPGDPRIVVGVIDTGGAVVPDLVGKIDGLLSVAPDDTLPSIPVANGSSNDDYGHGTAVASLIAANVDDGFGMAGFGGATHVVAVHAGAQGRFTDSDIANALMKLDSLGVRIVNLSLGSSYQSTPILVDAIHKAAADGVLLVAAAGNDHDRVSWPAADLQPSGGRRSYGLAVGATDMDGELADFSNSGAHLSLVAPGNSRGSCSGVLVALPRASALDDSCHPTWFGAEDAHYAYVAGTSFSAPEVAGVAALVWAVRPQLKNYEVADILKQSARRAPSTGWTPTMGCGLLDAGRAVQLAAAGSLGDAPGPDTTGAVCLLDGDDPPASPGSERQSISFGPLADKTFGDPDFRVRATASSGLPVSFTASGDCTILRAAVHITRFGACAITASQQGDADHLPAPDVVRIFWIAKGATVKALPASGSWGAPLRLPYRIYGKGDVAASITVRRNRTTIAQLARGFSHVESGREYTRAWKAPKVRTKGEIRFCVALIYRTRVSSSSSCAHVSLR